MALLLALALLILVPTLQRQIVTLVESLPNYREWFVGTAIPWLEQRTHLQLSTWLYPEYLIEQLRVHWERAGGIATTALGYLSRSGFAVFAMRSAEHTSELQSLMRIAYAVFRLE